MRWLRDILLLLILSAVCVGVVYWQINRAEDRERTVKAAAETHRLEMEIRYRAATKSVELNPRGWPMTVDPAWFERSPVPANPLLSEDHPWLEVAPAEQAELTHPPVRMVLSEHDATFWYNPHQGIVRARVPVMVSDEAALELYNRVNGTDLPGLHWDETAHLPKTVALAPHATDSGQQPIAGPAHPDPQPPKPRREPSVVLVNRKPRR